MKLIESIDAMKARSALMSGINIDFQYVQKLTPQVLNYTGADSDEFRETCATLESLCSKVIDGMEQIKELLPKNEK